MVLNPHQYQKDRCYEEWYVEKNCKTVHVISGKGSCDELRIFVTSLAEGRVTQRPHIYYLLSS